MKATVGAGALKNAVRFVSPAIHGLFYGVALEATDDGVNVVGGSSTGFRRSLIPDAETEDAGRIVVPLPLLSGVAGRAKGSLGLRVEDNRLVVRSARSRFVLPAMSDDQIPNIEVPDSFEHHVGSDEWLAWQRNIVPFVSRDATRPPLMQVVVDNGTVFGTDSHRLGFLPTSLPDMRLPFEVVHGSEADIAVRDNLIFVRADDNVVGAPVMHGETMPYRQIIPESFNVDVELDAVALREGLLEVMAIAQKKVPVALGFEGPELRVRIAAQDGEAETSVRTSGVVDPVEIGFRPDYLLDALKLFDGAVQVSMLSPLRPVLFSNGDVKHLLMPARLGA